MRKYVELINSQNPDLILIAGDLIDNSVRPLLHEPYAEVLSYLKAPMGIYMVPGNHEYISGIEDCIEFIEGTQIHLLRDSVITLTGGLQIIGRDDLSNHERKTLEQLLDDADRTLPMLLLDHQHMTLQKLIHLELTYR